MGEKWFEFVKRIKKEGNHASLKDAMKDASARKSEWNKESAPGATKKRVSKRKGKGAKKSRKSRKNRKSRKTRKSRK